MLISLDTNIWIFGLLKSNSYCEKILLNLSSFNIIIPNQVRMELVRNLPDNYVEEFYKLVNESGTRLDYERVPDMYISRFKSKGLKKGDAVIGGFCEWRKVDTIISDNRDFLRGLATEGDYFKVISPQKFCDQFGL